ncbi:hypothetical protein F3157_17795 [Virgibacillus dakarensis]|uniref:Uncharacterized protein n=1 Tax=Lentibacillus populi TaxID=1827502 RepID=A0A9W5TW64_9BACI|nr:MULTISPECIES: hypothetical protein [Bacillaceae]MBT2218426.1 hypothetical protein [Virgibacillus dakarensis]MTW87481.1 hypothetical protein [Virgibacillus dakarensis]GGB35788.1 hypothetical protein GCM10011409_11570 [Lentibacillus populi]
MLITLEELKDSKDHWFEIELLNWNGAQYQRIKSEECNSFQEVLRFINNLESEGKMAYYELTLDFNNKRVRNVRNLNDLLSSITKTRSMMMN